MWQPILDAAGSRQSLHTLLPARQSCAGLRRAASQRRTRRATSRSGSEEGHPAPTYPSFIVQRTSFPGPHFCRQQHSNLQPRAGSEQTAVEVLLSVYFRPTSIRKVRRRNVRSWGRRQRFAASGSGARSRRSCCFRGYGRFALGTGPRRAGLGGPRRVSPLGLLLNAAVGR